MIIFIAPPSLPTSKPSSKDSFHSCRNLIVFSFMSFYIQLLFFIQFLSFPSFLSLFDTFPSFLNTLTMFLFYPILRFYMFYPFYADFTIQFFILFTFPFFLISPVFPANIFIFNIFTF